MAAPRPRQPSTKPDVDKRTRSPRATLSPNENRTADHQAHTSVSSAATAVTNAPSTRAPATAALPVGVTVGVGDTVLVDVDVGRIEVVCTICVVDTTDTLTPAPDVSADVSDDATEDTDDEVLDDAADEADVLVAADALVSADVESVPVVESVVIEPESVPLLDESVALVVEAVVVSVAVVLSDAEAANNHQFGGPSI